MARQPRHPKIGSLVKIKEDSLIGSTDHINDEMVGDHGWLWLRMSLKDMGEREREYGWNDPDGLWAYKAVADGYIGPWFADEVEKCNAKAP